MKKLVIDIACRATERVECLEIRRKLFEKLYPFLEAAGLRVEFLTTFLPYLPNEEPVSLPHVRVLGEEAEEGSSEALMKVSVGSYEEALEAISL